MSLSAELLITYPAIKMSYNDTFVFNASGLGLIIHFIALVAKVADGKGGYGAKFRLMDIS